MSADGQIASIAAEIATLELIRPGSRLAHLRTRVIETGGTWDLPAADPATYDPLLKSIQLHGIFAMSDKIDELAKNWLKAARNTLDAHNEAMAAE
jgi:hypothetical protein